MPSAESDRQWFNAGEWRLVRSAAPSATRQRVLPPHRAPRTPRDGAQRRRRRSMATTSIPTILRSPMCSGHTPWSQPIGTQGRPATMTGPASGSSSSVWAGPIQAGPQWAAPRLRSRVEGTKGLVRRKFAGPSGGVTEQIVDVLCERNWTAGHKAQRYLDLGLMSRNEQLNLRLGGDLDPVQRIPRS